MCEIAIIDTDEASALELAEFAIRIYNGQRDSLGLVGVHDTGGEFQYSIEKWLEPELSEVEDFVREMQEADNVTRMIIHGRLATHGEVSKEHAHPLEVDCPECDIEYVIHNGIVRGHQRQRERHEDNGHEYATEVDSEVIAHVEEGVPADFDESKTHLLSYQPAYILLGNKRMYTFTNATYHLDSSGFMAMNRRQFGPDPSDKKYQEVIYHPSEDNA